MLKIIIPPKELFDSKKEVFFMSKEYELRLEHSLVSLSKWESKWGKPFLSKEDKTTEETLDYVRCMTITQNVDSFVYKLLSQKEIDEIVSYIDAPMTATKIYQENKEKNREIITSEIIYYWMISFNIPFECQTWHLNRLLTLISVCNIKNQPAKKLSRKELSSRNRALNEARKAKLNTRG